MNRMAMFGGTVVVCLSSALVACSSSSDSTGGTSSGGGGGTALAGASGSVSSGTGGGNAGGSGGSAGQTTAGAAGSSGSSAAGGSTGGAGGSGGSGGGSSAGQAFSPNATYTYVGMGSNAGISIVAGTIDGNGLIGPEWLIAMKGTGPDPVCIITVSADFLDASSKKLAHVDVIVDSPMYTSFGDPTQCIGKGDIGMGQAEVTFDSGDMSQVTQINYGFNGNIDPAATKLTDVTADGIAIADFSATQKKVTGVVTNHSTSTTYKYPEIALYPVDGAGRPLAKGDTLTADMLTPSGTWNFLHVRARTRGQVRRVPGVRRPLTCCADQRRACAVRSPRFSRTPIARSQPRTRCGAGARR